MVRGWSATIAKILMLQNLLRFLDPKAKNLYQVLSQLSCEANDTKELY